MKECNKCHKVLSNSQFHKKYRDSDILHYVCRDCRRILYREQRLNHKEVFRKKDKKYYQANKEKIKKKKQEYYLKNKEKIAAQNKVKNALFRGTLIREETCDECMTRGSIQAHHDDYSKPLEVRWLCRKCHMRFHHGK